MKFILSRSARFACPSCGSSQLSRSHGNGVFEHLLHSVFQVKPYRCMSCDYRHFRYRPTSTHSHKVLPSAPK
jgi:predicted RNA-binding Zn-ribbon protein involved in translation (DUF1610 family)